MALRHWKQKGTSGPLRVTTKASLWALGYRSLLLGLSSHHWVVPSATTCCFPFLFREEVRQGDVREMSSREKGSGTWRQKQGQEDKCPPWVRAKSLWSHRAPVEEYTDSWISGVTKHLHCFCFSKDPGSKQSKTSGSILLPAVTLR